MKTKNKTKKINKTRKNINKGGHKVPYDYQGNIDAGTNKPLTGKNVHENNCLACALYSLGFMSESTARYLQRISTDGAPIQFVIDIVNMTYGEGHTFKPYETEESVKEYLKPGEATLGFCGGIEENGVDEWGHYFIVFRSKNGNIYIIDSQKYVVTPISKYLSSEDWLDFQILTEPDLKVRPKYKLIIPEVIQDAGEKAKKLYIQKVLAMQPPMPLPRTD